MLVELPQPIVDHVREILEALLALFQGFLGEARIGSPWILPLVSWTDHKGLLDHMLKDGPGLPDEARLTGYVELLKQMTRDGNHAQAFHHQDGLINSTDCLTKADLRARARTALAITQEGSKGHGQAR